jgi:diguanylate cyclase (GGDEF)-like protein
VTIQEEQPTASWAGASAAEIAEAAGASDLFVFRRVGPGRLAHVGGAGRGVGWAGIVDVGVADEPLIDAALASGDVVRRTAHEPWNVFGPYYAAVVAVVPVGADLLVVFGADANTTLPADRDLHELARYAGDALIEVAPAKRLADELEALTAVAALLNAPAGTYAEGLQRLVDEATRSLSCNLGFVYVPELNLAVAAGERAAGMPEEELRSALRRIARERERPSCVQQARGGDLPSPLSATDGVVSYYLLGIDEPLGGILLLLHTEESPARGFTQLCQSLGVKLVEAAQPLLSAALLRDRLHDDLERTAAEARRDPLTGLANRLGWDEAIAGTSACAELPATVVELDCGGLKAVNDSLGHETGDRLLRRAADLLRASVRDGDVVARLGGDEFGLLLCGADERAAERVLARLGERIAAAAAAEPDEPPIRLAIGVATERDGDLRAAQQRADRQLLDAKRERRAAA